MRVSIRYAARDYTIVCARHAIVICMLHHRYVISRTLTYAVAYGDVGHGGTGGLVHGAKSIQAALLVLTLAHGSLVYKLNFLISESDQVYIPF